MEEKPQDSTDRSLVSIALQQEVSALMQRMTQLAMRLDNQSEIIARATNEHASFASRLTALEDARAGRTDYIQKILLPLLIASLTLSLGNLALSVTILFNVVAHVLGK